MYNETDRRYNMLLGPQSDADLKYAAEKLGIEKSDALRRAIVLLRNSVETDTIKLVTDSTE